MPLQAPYLAKHHIHCKLIYLEQCLSSLELQGLSTSGRTLLVSSRQLVLNKELSKAMDSISDSC